MGDVREPGVLPDAPPADLTAGFAGPQQRTAMIAANARRVDPRPLQSVDPLELTGAAGPMTTPRPARRRS